MTENPYSSPADHDDQLLHLTVKRLLEYRSASPTVICLRQLRVLPRLALFAAIAVPLMLVLNLPGTSVEILVGMLLGVVIRETAVARKLGRLWKIQKELLDWPKIEAISRGMENLPPDTNLISL
jgi:hypothetical protein